uniref:Rab-GAP TBC domain-containing protein n=2 Tax=Lotharella oceanica TaxID=641309 RepID=A0A7S2TSC6_9EUKA|eukprot:CAMPEP_0170175256 /NCGR_PEP_ID=MMETSP0040_2-20121228/8361_1 /TAXON_ID=641309 /ORGANISM="Lotharella oceanica, Strain CCMP622" /LENGTH=413 /DNA_ID=CAMNT_0010417173 /DNA_START=92 /DNA_END=1333 /DNA_ORIENTATION=+
MSPPVRPPVARRGSCSVKQPHDISTDLMAEDQEAISTPASINTPETEDPEPVRPLADEKAPKEGEKGSGSDVKWYASIDNPGHNADLRARVRAGLNDEERRYLWPRLCGACKRSRKNTGIYQRLLKKKLKEEDRESIKKDLPRMVPHDEGKVFNEKGPEQERLYNLLRAYCIFNGKIGYGQGMGVLAGLILRYVPNEELAFWMFERLMNDPMYKCAGLYDKCVTKLRSSYTVHDWLFAKHDEELFSRFEEQEISASAYTSCWYQTRFYKLDPELGKRVLDIFLLEGEKSHIVFRVALTLLSEYRQGMMSHPEGPLNYIQDHIRCKAPKKVSLDVNSLISRSLEMQLPLSNTKELQDLNNIDRKAQKILKQEKRMKMRETWSLGCGGGSPRSLFSPLSADGTPRSTGWCGNGGR